jgi:hypothetical protein
MKRNVPLQIERKQVNSLAATEDNRKHATGQGATRAVHALKERKQIHEVNVN